MNINITKNMTARDIAELCMQHGFTLHAVIGGGFNVVMNRVRQA